MERICVQDIYLTQSALSRLVKNFSRKQNDLIQNLFLNNFFYKARVVFKDVERHGDETNCILWIFISTNSTIFILEPIC